VSWPTKKTRCTLPVNGPCRGVVQGTPLSLLEVYGDYDSAFVIAMNFFNQHDFDHRGSIDSSGAS
jgi:hypothetical protein